MSEMDLDNITDEVIRDAVSEYIPFLSNGIIRRRGTFDREPLATVYFYNLMLNGEGENVYEESELEYTEFKITPEDAAIFPELTKSIGKYYRVRGISSGFIYGWIDS